MNDFHDPQIERLLGGASGAFPDVNVAFGQVERRVRQVKRRRVMVAGSAACVALFAGVAFAASRTGTNAPGLQPADSFAQSTVSTPDSGPGVTNDSMVDDSVESSTPTGGTMISLPVPNPGGGSGGPGGVPGGSTPSSSPASGPGSSTPTSNTTATSNSAPTTTAPTTTSPPAPQFQTFSGVGGSVTVKLANGVLSLQSYSATSGYTAEVTTNRSDRVEVRFDNGSNETRIRVDLVGGSMQPRIDEN